jgi:hypothetical protein
VTLRIRDGLFVIFCGMMFIQEVRSEPAEKDKTTTALLFAPFSSLLISIVENEITKEEPDALFVLGATDFGFRGHYVWGPKIGVTVQLEYSSFQFFTKTTHTGVRIGPRIPLQNKEFLGWTICFFVLIGRTVISSGAYPLASWSVLGAGAEITYTWTWDSVLLESGLGVYQSHNVGYRTYAESMKETTAPDGLLPLKPMLTLGVGYAF